jgi:hypothetical protein
MSKHTGAFKRTLLAAALLIGAALSGRAQNMQGYSDIWYDETTDSVVFWAFTLPDYATGYYYESSNRMLIYKDGVYFTPWETPSNPYIGPWAEGYCELPAEPGVSYSTVTTHTLWASYCWWEIDPYFCPYGCYDWYDAYGYSFLSQNQPPYYSYIMRISPMICTAAMTAVLYAVTQTLKDPFVPVLDCDPPTNPVTRGTTVTCTVSGAGSTRVSGWRFEGGGATVTGPSSGASWGGTMVQGGNVTATIPGYGSLQASIQVNSRSGWHTQPASPFQVPNGWLIVNGQTQTLPVPPQASGEDAGVGVAGWEAHYSGLQHTVIGGSGPNAGFAYYGSPLTFTSFFFQYTINPDLENSGSTFSQKQYGACGFISWDNLLTQTRRHEYNHATQSHHGKYANAMNDPANNPGDYIEARVALPSANKEQFDTDSGVGVASRFQQIGTLTAQQPHAVNYSESGAPLGNVNYAPYANCP